MSIFDNHLQTLLRVYCPGCARVKGNDQADRLEAKQPSQMACILEDLKCWGAWDTTCWHKAKDITQPITCWRGVKSGNAQQSSLEGPEKAAVHDVNTGIVSKATLGTFLRDWVEHRWAFPSAWTPSWTKLPQGIHIYIYMVNFPLGICCNRPI